MSVDVRVLENASLVAGRVCNNQYTECLLHRTVDCSSTRVSSILLPPPTNKQQRSTMTTSRLPTHVVPRHYDLTYRRIDLIQHVFEGSVKIQLEAAESVILPSLTLNACEIQLQSATLLEGDGSKRVATEFRYDLKNQRCDVLFDELEWTKGNQYTLSIEFQGTLNDQMHGLYRSTYVGLDGVTTHTMATTQFEATDARRAFPCWDEPALKATFQLTVVIPVHLQCVSNTPTEAVHSTLENKTITFQRTPKMSTYLLALVVGTFDSISKTSRGIVTTIYTVPGKAHQAHFCLDVAWRCLDLLQDLFQIPYPLPKSDLLAIPDFAAGAMENWGCVTYREAKVLVEPGTTSETTQRGIARTVCHELAHMWFGNWTTMEFWTQLWLKEGVARFMEFVGIDTLFPEWNAWEEFVQSVYGLAMSLDAMNSSHPVEVPVHHPDEISEIFDSISYAKGASIIRMVYALIGKDDFFKGMRIYLNRHAYGNAVTNDLWGALEEASSFPVTKFMAPWTLQMGYPILRIGNDGSIASERFLSSGPEPDLDAPWPIPVTALVEGEDQVQGPWVIRGPHRDDTGALQEKIREWGAGSKWFKLNVGQTGFFRVAYSSEQWSRLSNVLAPDGPLSVTDRLGLITDSFAAGQAGYTPLAASLQLISEFGDHKEVDYVVWQELAENLSTIASVFRSEPSFGKYQTLLRAIFRKQFDKLGWHAKDGESPRIGTLRGTMIDILGIAGDNDVISESHNCFQSFCQGQLAIPGDLQGPIFRCALRHDEDSVFAKLQMRVEDPQTSPEERRYCLQTMGRVKDPQRHAMMLDYVVFSGKVRLQDSLFPMGSLANTHDAGGVACWEFVQKHYEHLQGGPMASPMVAVAVRGLRREDQCQGVEAFYKGASMPRRVAQALEVVRTRAKRLKRDAMSLKSFLESQISK